MAMQWRTSVYKLARWASKSIVMYSHCVLNSLTYFKSTSAASGDQENFFGFVATTGSLLLEGPAFLLVVFWQALLLFGHDMFVVVEDIKEIISNPEHGAEPWSRFKLSVDTLQSSALLFSIKFAISRFLKYSPGRNCEEILFSELSCDLKLYGTQNYD